MDLPRLPRRAGNRRRLCFAAAVLTLTFAHLAAFAQTAPSGAAANAESRNSASRIESLMQTLEQVRSITSVALSPDGNSIAWAFNGARGSELHLTGIPAGTPDRIIAPDTIAAGPNAIRGACTDSHPAWSPDGKQLAFLSDCSGSGSQWETTAQDNIFVWTPATNAMKQVSHLHGEVSSLEWSPDGKSIAFLYVENATRPAGALNAMKPWSGVIGEDGVEVQRVYAVSTVSDRADFLTPANMHVYEFAFGTTYGDAAIAFVAAPPPGENTWWVAKLYMEIVTAGTSSLLPSVETPGNPDATSDTPVGIIGIIFDPTTSTTAMKGLQVAVPRFSPDGKRIAFIGGLMSDQGSVGGDIYVVPIVGREPKDVTPNRPASPAYIAWLDNHTLAISEHLGGSTHITAIDLTTGKDIPSIDLILPATIIAGTDEMSVSTSNTANVAFIRESFDRGPEIWAGPLDNLKQATHLNDTVKPPWGKAESIDYSNDGFRIQGWLLYPAGWSPSDAGSGKKYPLLVSVHGGPSSAVTPRWPGATYNAVPFSALGYFVFLPNPRGSFGQGEKFTQANVKDFGYGDLRDVLAGVDLIEKRFPIDPDREGITGWSYGGFMTMFAVTQTTRFKAAIAGAGISDWKSYYGENSIDQWMVPFFGATVYDDPAVYARSSAIDFIKQAKTPTLLLVGDRDGECPAPQSFEFWHALKAEGVKTQLVVYPNEGHHLIDPEHRRDALRRALDWFETQMPAR